MRALLVLAVTAATMGASAALAGPASVTTQTQASTTITLPATISVTQDLNFGASINTSLTSPVITSSISGVNANVVLAGSRGDELSVSVPASFDVVRTGGTETLTVRTVGPSGVVAGQEGFGPNNGLNTNGTFTSAAIVTGTLDTGLLSFSVGGTVTMANNVVPGNYHGVLTVVAQYN
jgi:hypothetical protein